jgi:dipeptidyl-peptidase-4
LKIGSVAFALFSIVTSSPLVKRQNGSKLVSFADAFGGQFGVRRTTLQWTSQGADGSYIDVDSSTGDLIISNIVTNGTSTFVKSSDVATEAQDPYDYSIQPSGDHVLYTTNYKKQYRHSFFADYYIFDVKAKTTVPLAADQDGGELWIQKWTI